MFALGVVATFLWFMSGPAARARTSTVQHRAHGAQHGVGAIARQLPARLLEGDSGTSLVVSVIGLTFVYDTAAFLSGSVWGGQFFQRPLAPSVSPKKSIEGVIIGTLVTVVVAVTLVTSFVDPFENQRIEALLLGLVVAAAATFGDLAESLVKRDMGIKDMGSILPGPRGRARPHRLAAVRGAGGVLPVPHHRRLSHAPPLRRSSERSASLGVVLSA